MLHCTLPCTIEWCCNPPTVKCSLQASRSTHVLHRSNICYLYPFLGNIVPTWNPCSLSARRARPPCSTCIECYGLRSGSRSSTWSTCTYRTGLAQPWSGWFRSRVSKSLLDSLILCSFSTWASCSTCSQGRHISSTPSSCVHHHELC
jgi:hypothetical protein